MKKTWVRFLGMLLALLMALGCTAAFAEGDDFSGTVTISLYSAKGVQEAWDAVGAAYTAKHPNVTVVVDLNRRTAMRTGLRPRSRAMTCLLYTSRCV